MRNCGKSLSVVAGVVLLGHVYADAPLPSTMVVTADVLRMHIDPTIQSPLRGTLFRGTIVRVKERGKSEVIDGRSAPWFEVEIYGRSGWVFGGYLSTLAPPKYSNTDPAGCVVFPPSGVPSNFPGGLVGRANYAPYQFGPGHDFFYFASGLGDQDERGKWTVHDGSLLATFRWDGGLSDCIANAYDGAFGAAEGGGQAGLDRGRRACVEKFKNAARVVTLTFKVQGSSVFVQPHGAYMPGLKKPQEIGCFRAW